MTKFQPFLILIFWIGLSFRGMTQEEIQRPILEGNEVFSLTDSVQKELINTSNIQEEEDYQTKPIAEKIPEKQPKNEKLGVAVIGLMQDTLFFIHHKIGASTAANRSEQISKKIKILSENDDFSSDSLLILPFENNLDLVYGEIIIASVSDADAQYAEIEKEKLAENWKVKILDSIEAAKKERSVWKWLLRIFLVALVFAFAYGLIWAIQKGYRWSLKFIIRNKKKFLKDLSYKDYTFLKAEQELAVILFAVKILRWVIYAISAYILLPLLFSIFPFTRGWADYLFHLIWSPFRGILISIWEYLPNLFSILVIYFVIKYANKLIRYVFSEIQAEKLQISGFHADWAMPTYSILRFLLYAFMFVLIFPYLPGSDSEIFKGVSVFIGILFSLGSSTAIANMVAGLVITYMRPFKIGDRIKIGEVTGDVVEKTLLVTRIKTIKNEEITIPNSSVLSGNTVNYSTHARQEGLIVHTTVTIGYDVPWSKIEAALIDAAKRCKWLEKKPTPFVLQTALDDFYVAYQLNAYTKEASKQAIIYSEMHKHIQDSCNENGIEILSPHYRAARDGNMSTIPENYLPKDYVAPSFQVKTQSKD